MGGLLSDDEDDAVKAALFVVPFLAACYLCFAVGYVTCNRASAGRHRAARWLFLPITGLAFFGFLASFFAFISQGYAVIGPWDGDAAARASAKLPAHMRDSSHAGQRYADSTIRVGLHRIVCVGSDAGGGDGQRAKLACASDHIFSPVSPRDARVRATTETDEISATGRPEPPPLHGLGVRAFLNVTIADKLCGREPGTEKDDRDSFSRNAAPRRAAFYDGAATRAQRRVPAGRRPPRRRRRHHTARRSSRRSAAAPSGGTATCSASRRGRASRTAASSCRGSRPRPRKARRTTSASQRSAEARGR